MRWDMTSPSGHPDHARRVGHCNCCGLLADIVPMETVGQQDGEGGIAGGGAWPPAGFVDRHGAAAMFATSSRTWLTWQRDGRVTCGQLHRRPCDGHCVKLYPISELERLRAELGQVGQPYPDPGRPGVWRVPLRGQAARRAAMVDERDLPLVRGRKWNWQERSDGTGGVVILARPRKPLHRL